MCAQFNGKISKEIIAWFIGQINKISGTRAAALSSVTLHLIQQNEGSKILDLLKVADLGIEAIETTEEPFKIFDTFPPELQEAKEEFMNLFKKLDQMFDEEKESQKIRIMTHHKKFSSDNSSSTIEKFEIDDESTGTQKLFNLAGPLIDTLENGKVLIIDELDSSLHPLIIQAIINLFNSCANKNAQLIFNCHDTNLLSNEYFRRDQIWFTEKDRYGAADLYSLVDFKTNGIKVRNDASFGKNYIVGKYGAIPFLGNFEEVIKVKK